MLQDRSFIADTINKLHPDLEVTPGGNIRLTLHVDGVTIYGEAYSFENAALMLKARYERHKDDWAKKAILKTEIEPETAS